MKTIRSVSLAASAVAIGTMALAAPAMAAGPTASVTPNKGLTNGKVVTVKFSHYPANQQVAAIQCSKPIKAQSDAQKYCNVKGAKLVKSSATGSGTLKITIVVGKVGTAGQCKSKGSCVIGVAAPFVKPPVGKFVKISFK